MNFPSSFPPPREPAFVPRLLDGKYRVPVRLGIVLVVTVGTLLAVILAVAALQSVTEIVGGSAANQALKKP